MSASTSSVAGEFKFEPPRRLFETRAIPKKSDLYDVSPDGLRLLMNLPYEWASDSPITVMTLDAKTAQPVTQRHEVRGFV